jgi:hypothetical protein
LFVALAACSKKKDDAPTAGAASGSAAMAPDNGSAAMAPTPPAGSGSAMAAGSGSEMAAGSGSGSAAMGSGSAVAAGSGSAVAETPSKMGDSPFDKLTSEEKAEFMKKKVVPAMKIEFQKFDAKTFANFGCKTCHGKDPKATKFKMPNPELPKLDFAALQAGKQKPKMAEFMGKVVKPEMAKILGEKEFDGKDPKAGGFGCLECHEQKK